MPASTNLAKGGWISKKYLRALYHWAIDTKCTSSNKISAGLSTLYKRVKKAKKVMQVSKNLSLHLSSLFGTDFGLTVFFALLLLAFFCFDDTTSSLLESTALSSLV